MGSFQKGPWKVSVIVEHFFLDNLAWKVYPNEHLKDICDVLTTPLYAAGTLVQYYWLQVFLMGIMYL